MTFRLNKDEVANLIEAGKLFLVGHWGVGGQGWIKAKPDTPCPLSSLDIAKASLIYRRLDTREIVVTFGQPFYLLREA